MCLDVVHARLQSNSNWSVGYKVYKKLNGRYIDMYGYHRPCKQWLQSESGTLGNTDDIDNQYESGFHIIVDLVQAKKYQKYRRVYGDYLLIKVRYRHPVAYGTQKIDGNNMNIVVAKEMYIEGPVR